MVLTQLVHVFECKSETKGLLHIPIFNNKKLLLAVLTSLTVVFGAVYFPPLQVVFSTVALTPKEILTVLGYCMCGPVLAALVRPLFRPKENEKTQDRKLKKKPA